MKNLLSILAIALVYYSSAQCVSLTCQSDINVVTNSCSETVTFTPPAGVDLCSTISTTFTYTGAQQTWVVPAGVTSINVNAYGAQGGANWVNNDNFGGQVIADLPVTPGTTIYIYVGQKPNGIAGGWNGGGNGEGAGQGGGGASDIRIGGTSYNDRMIVAGGAGGAGYWSSMHVNGGLGGGLIGGYGGRVNYATNPGGEPGTQVGSGNGTCVSLNNPICTGGFGYGGAPSGCGCEGYGGGGGWYGGAGSGNCRGGGGGSSYTHPSATNVTHNQGVRIGNGEVTISYATSSNVVDSQIAGLSSGSSFPVGTTTNEFMSVLNGDTVYCSFDVIVIDTVPPTLNVPSNMTVCGASALNNISSGANDNCGTTDVSYVITGATSASGSGEANGTIFNVGTSTVTYTVIDQSGNSTVDAFDVIVLDLPIVTLASFASDSICSNYAPINLPAGTPAGGVYSGSGVSGNMFDPSMSGTGGVYVTYTYTDNNGCSNQDSSLIIVDPCLSIGDINQEYFEIYPIPTHDIVIIQFKDSEVHAWEVINSQGQVILHGTAMNSQELDFSKEANGIYYFKTDMNGRSFTQKIVKQ